jgi:hypothetical protein
MCLGSSPYSSRPGTRTAFVGRLDDGRVVLAFVPDAQVGEHLLVHTGIPAGTDPAAARGRSRSRHGGGAVRPRDQVARLRDRGGERRLDLRERAGGEAFPR